MRRRRGAADDAAAVRWHQIIGRGGAADAFCCLAFIWDRTWPEAMKWKREYVCMVERTETNAKHFCTQQCYG